MRIVLAALLFAFALSAGADAQVWIMSPASQSGHWKAPPIVTCNGVVDLSVGCALPMLGGAS